jgi:hypothetical protein
MDNIDFDAPVNAKEQGNYKELPKGEYRFAVVLKPIVPVRSKGEKTKDAWMADMMFAIFAIDDENYERQIGVGFDHLIRHTSTDWKVMQFFKSIGEREHDEVITPKWDEVPGAQGRAIFFPSEYNGKTSMKVEKYLPPEETTKTDKPDFA